MSVSLSNCDVYCMYGIPDKGRYFELLHWLDEKPTHYLVILHEEEPPLLEHPRIRFGKVGDDESLKKIAWEFLFLNFDYDDTKASSRMAYLRDGIHLVASDFKERGLDRFFNFVKNGPRLKKAYLAKDLFGCFSQIPAIICGAGPSLELEAPYLRTLKDRALLFGGGTTLSVLSELGISPHFSGMIDPHPPTKRSFKSSYFSTPTFFQTRAHPNLLSHVEGPLLWAGGSENDLFDQEHFEGGWNVSTFLTALACHMGCNPIILVGVDLAQTEKKPYATGLDRPEGGDLIPIEADLYTRLDWLYAAEWFQEFANKHPEVQWINASNGLPLKGFSKKGIRELSFETQEDLAGRVHAAIQKTRQGAKTLDVEEIQISLARVSELCMAMLQLLEQIFPKAPAKSGEYTLLQVDMEKEIAYERFLKPVWSIWKHVFAREMPKELPREYGLECNGWLFIKRICDEAGTI